jgi:chemotaxis signal transduction protein
MNPTHETDPAKRRAGQCETVDGSAVLRLLDKPLSDEELQENTRRVAMPVELAEQDVLRLLVFRSGDEQLAVEAVQVNQVAKATHVHRIPHRTNTVIRGLCNLDGELMLCADLERLLELGTVGRDIGKAGQRWMIVLGGDQGSWVVEVDAIEGVMGVARNRFRRSPITVDASLARYTESLVPLELVPGKPSTASLLDLQSVISGFQAALR